MNNAFEHRPVMLEPAVAALLAADFDARRWQPGAAASPPRPGVWIDGTFGRGGHSRALLAELAAQARLVVFDKDPQAITEARTLAARDHRLTVCHQGFGALDTTLDELGLEQVDGVLLDVGVSSPQIDDAERGFSFMRDGPLDMRMDTTRGPTAAQWLATASESEIREVIKHHGEERYAFQIAKAIAARRAQQPIGRTHELAELVAGVVRTREKGQHPATRTFQAIRIHINRELAELADALAGALSRLAPGGRLAVISFHSLEDRLVKQFMAAAANPGAASARLPLRESERPQPILRLLGKRTAEAQEVAENPRARSAILRVAERTTTPLPGSARSYLPTGGRSPDLGGATAWSV
ncbi:MAG: 16S rRNA (cytosine(1402)-N(4))-methyltransferase RsmH [Pigmentiphaga sp.]